MITVFFILVDSPWQFYRLLLHINLFNIVKALEIVMKLSNVGGYVPAELYVKYINGYFIYNFVMVSCNPICEPCKKLHLGGKI